MRIIAAVILVVDNFISAETEDEGVLLAYFLDDLHVRAVHGSQCGRAVEHELHVTCTGRLFTCSRDLLGNVCRRKDHLRIGYAVVLDKYYFQFIVNGLVVVHNLSHGVDQFDDLLRAGVSCGSFRSEDKGSGIELHARISLQLIVQIDHMQDIQKLAFVLVKSLNLYVEDGMRIHLHTVVLQDIFRKALLVLELDVHKFLLGSLVVHIQFQLADLGEICDPVRTDVVCYPFCQKLVSVKEEASLGDAVGLVVEFLRHHLIEVLQLLILQNLGMKLCNAVYGEAGNDGEMRHFYLAVIDDSHFFDLLIVARIFGLHFDNEAAVDLLDDLIYTGKQSGEQLDRPFFQGFGHNGMVGVSHTFGGNFPRLIPAEAFLVHEDTHQLCHRDGGMGIVHLENCLLIELPDVAVMLFIFLDRCLKAGGYEEVLLFQTQLLTCHMVIVRVKHLYDIAGKVLLLHCLLIITLVERVQTKVHNGLRIPDTKGIYDVVVVSQDRHIVGNRLNRLVSLMDEAVGSCSGIIFHTDISAEMYFLGIFRTAQFEGVSVLQPVIRNLNLESVLDLLLEHTVMITDAASVSTVVQCRQRIQEAGCQTAETAVAQSRIRLLVLDHVQIQSQLLQSLFHLIVGGKVEKIVSQGAAHQELHGHVVYDLGILLFKSIL